MRYSRMSTSPRYLFQSDGGDHAESDSVDELKKGAEMIAREGLWQEITDQESGKREVRSGFGSWTAPN
jgi:hypothetical protein